MPTNQAGCPIDAHSRSPSEESELGEREDRLADQKVVEHLNVEHGEGSLDLLRQSLVTQRGDRAARWVVVSQDYGHSAVGEGLLDDLARVDAGGVDRAAKELEVFDEPTLLVQQQDCKDFVSPMSHSALQERTSALWRFQHGMAWAEVARSDSFGALEYLGRGRALKYVAVAYVESM